MYYKKLFFSGLCLHAYACLWAQVPLNYERTLSLYGRPVQVKEYYYEYHTQERAPYYLHNITYNDEGQVMLHTKTNKGLRDSLPPLFLEIVDPRPLTITYTFDYDKKGRLHHFGKLSEQEQVADIIQEEEWLYDAHDMLIHRYYWEHSDTGRVIKNPSYKRVITRDQVGKVQSIHKLSYSFAERGLITSEMSVYKYKDDQIDTLLLYGIDNDGTKSLKEIRYDLLFRKYNDLNTDALLFASYKTIVGQVHKTVWMQYDSLERIVSYLERDTSGQVHTKTNWIYEPYRTTRVQDDFYSLETNYDRSGYETYREEYEGGTSLYMPSEVTTRTFGENKIISAMTEIYDPVMLFYRKDTEYLYEYGTVSHTTDIHVTEYPHVYPNPSSGTVYFRNIENISHVSMFTLAGVPIAVPALQKEWNLSLPRGIYILRLMSHNMKQYHILLDIE